MYEECLNCAKLGASCDGPNFLAMSAAELHEWCKERKKTRKPEMSNAEIAQAANMPKGTVDRLMAGEHIDFRYESIRPLVKALVGGKWDGNPCSAPSGGERAELHEKIRQLEAAIQWRDDKIKHFTDENARLHSDLADANERHKHSQDFLRSEMRRKNKSVTILAVLLGLSLAVIIAALVIDRLNPNMGFFWLSGLLDGRGGLFSLFS